MAAVVVWTALPKRADAERLARKLVAKRLAACSTVAGGGVSFYRWKGKLEKAGEFLLFIKTSRKKFPLVRDFIRSVHPYELPEIIALPVAGGSRAYLRWVEECVK